MLLELAVLALLSVISLGIVIYIVFTQMNFRGRLVRRCRTIMPYLRKPSSVQQMFWGGWTCPKCGAEMDKWGTEIVPSPPQK